MTPLTWFVLGYCCGLATFYLYCMILAYPSYRVKLEAAKGRNALFDEEEE